MDTKVETPSTRPQSLNPGPSGSDSTVPTAINGTDCAHESVRTGRLQHPSRRLHDPVISTPTNDTDCALESLTGRLQHPSRPQDPQGSVQVRRWRLPGTINGRLSIPNGSFTERFWLPAVPSTPLFLPTCTRSTTAQHVRKRPYSVREKSISPKSYFFGCTGTEYLSFSFLVALVRNTFHFHFWVHWYGKNSSGPKST